VNSYAYCLMRLQLNIKSRAGSIRLARYIQTHVFYMLTKSDIDTFTIISWQRAVGLLTFIIAGLNASFNCTTLHIKHMFENYTREIK